MPSGLYEALSERIPLAVASSDVHFSPLAQFLTRRCSDAFLLCWASQNSAAISVLADCKYLHEWHFGLMAKLKSIDALPEVARAEAARVLRDRAVEEFDSTWTKADLACLFTYSELQDLRADVRRSVIPNIDLFLDEASEGWDADSNPADWYSAASETVDALRETFAGDDDIDVILSQAASSIQSRLAYEGEDYRGPVHSSFAAEAHSDDFHSDRNPFDDVDAGHK